MKNEPKKTKRAHHPSPDPEKEIDIEKIVADMPSAYMAWEEMERDPGLKRVEAKIEKLLEKKS